ncbi:MAG: 50S ribosomal protein L22 [Candidatus Anstonellales archaeon]
MKYCHKKVEGERYAFAQGEGLNVSFKDLSQVCKNISGKTVEEALHFLERVMRGLQPVRYFSHNKKLGHRKELGGKKGRYPIKAARVAYKILQNALANANYLRFSNPIIHHICANKGEIYPRLRSKGRAGRSDYETANLQIVLRDSGVKEENKTNLSEQKTEQKTEAEQKTEQKTEARI